MLTTKQKISTIKFCINLHFMKQAASLYGNMLIQFHWIPKPNQNPSTVSYPSIVILILLLWEKSQNAARQRKIAYFYLKSLS